MKIDHLVSSFATFDDTRRYRYELGRTWDESRPACAFIMLNPSTADAFQLDPTVRRCFGFAKRWGYGSLLVGNLFALRSTDPAALARCEDPVGPDNDRVIADIVDYARFIVLAWGTHGALMGRGWDVRKAICARVRSSVAALGWTRCGEPIHPLYVRADAPVVCVG